MNVEDLMRSALHDAADRTVPISDLHVTSMQAGRRRRTSRRVATASGVALSVAAITGAGVLVAANTGGNGHPVVGPATQRSTQQVVADPWWQTWTIGRHDGAVDPHFLAAAQPTYDGESAPEQIKAWANGTTPDGTQWVLFSDQSSPHVLQWLQGWDGQPDFGESSQQVTPALTWTSWSIPTRAAHDGTTGVQQWLIVVGRPGTTGIDYSPDGTTWQPMDLQQGIGVLKIATTTGFPPASARVRLSDAAGVYATGTPAGAGAGQSDSEPTASPTATTAPSATPTTSRVVSTS